MPCACKIPIVQYPETAEWGPLMWDILHGLAEKSGNNTNLLLQADEIRCWTTLLNSVGQTLPCDICSKHYKEYLLANPITIPSYSELKTYIKTWLWTLHNEINGGNDKPSFSYSDLTAKYSGIPVKIRLQQLAAPIQRAMMHNGVRLLNWKTFERLIKTQLSF
jgi:hypothetical protein